jgi:5-methylcytosine-specific restriction endonuclease McrA
VYEKVRTGIWVFNGVFRLTDAWAEQIDGRRVFKFRLEMSSETPGDDPSVHSSLETTRLIPTPVKLEVWKRDRGRCVECGATDNLHFDHVIPWSRGGSSLTAANVQLLCARHNLAKHNTIQ